MSERPEIVTDQKARQGPKGIPVLVVLVIGLILAGALVYAMMGWTTAEAPKAPAPANPASSTLPQNPTPPPPGSTAAPPKQ